MALEDYFPFQKNKKLSPLRIGMHMVADKYILLDVIDREGIRVSQFYRLSETNFDEMKAMALRDKRSLIRLLIEERGYRIIDSDFDG